MIIQSEKIEIMIIAIILKAEHVLGTAPNDLHVSTHLISLKTYAVCIIIITIKQKVNRGTVKLTQDYITVSGKAGNDINNLALNPLCSTTMLCYLYCYR